MTRLSLSAPCPDAYAPGGGEFGEALARVTHLSIGAHHDDLEFMSLAPIEHCRKTAGAFFGGVVCTDGRGSARAGAMAGTTADDLAAGRIAEQREAARLGRYAAVLQLGYPSRAVKERQSRATLEGDLAEILRASTPEHLYIHNFADKHPTHVAVALASLAAARSLAPDKRPLRLYGCEGWRDLGWMPDRRKVLLDAGNDTAFVEALCGIFRTQIEGGKRYDRAILGRKFSNATLFDPHAPDAMELAEVAVDLTPLLLDDSLDPAAFTLGLVDEFREEVRRALDA
jgi:LmbE family N-acetylglucosaminyl deacetylase